LTVGEHLADFLEMAGGVHRRERFVQGHEQPGVVQDDGLIQRLTIDQGAILAIAAGEGVFPVGRGH
jgi:hypothetical protein